MIFDLGDLLTLGIVVVMFLAYRQIDKNNRSLDKIRKFADMVRSDLEEFIRLRTSEINDFDLQMKLHQKTGSEIIKRIKTIEENLESRAPELEGYRDRIDEYGQSLQTLFNTAAQVEENLQKLKEESEFVDKVGRKLQSAQQQMQQIEAQIPAFRQDILSANEKGLEELKGKVLAGFEKEMKGYGLQLSEAETRMEGFHKFLEAMEGQTQRMLVDSQKLLGDSLQKTLVQASDTYKIWDEKLGERAKAANAALDAAEKAFHGRLEKTADEAEALNLTILKDLESRMNSQSVALEARFKQQLEVASTKINGGVEDLVALLEDNRRDIESHHGELLARMEDNKKSVDAHQSDLLALMDDNKKEIDTHHDELLTLMDGNKKEVDSHHDELLSLMEDNRKEIDTRHSGLQSSFGDIQKLVDGLKAKTENDLALLYGRIRQESEAKVEALRKEIDQTLLGSQKSIGPALQSLEDRLAEHQNSFSYHLDKMEEVAKEIGLLDTNLRASVERSTVRIQEEFKRFDDKMALVRQAEEVKLRERLEETQSSMADVEKGLEELKSHAYENVSQKLQVFEDDFFEDLQKRNSGMQKSFDDWQLTVKTRLDELTSLSEAGRQTLEKSYNEGLRARVMEIQNQTQLQFEKYDQSLRDGEEKISSRFLGLQTLLDTTSNQFKEELFQLDSSIHNKLDQQVSRLELEQSESLAKTERDLEIRLKSLGEKMETGRVEIFGLMDSAKSDVGLWQTRTSQKLKEAEEDLLERYQSFKSSTISKIGELKDEFQSQKDDLVLSTNQERTDLKNELSSLREGVDNLETLLGQKSESALEAFQRDYDSFAVDIQKRVRDLQTDMDLRLKDFREAVQDSREKADQLNKKLFSRIDDQYTLMSANLEEIDKRQKGFIQQTKLFERADTMKLELQEAIEDLKSDMARIDIQKKDLFEVENQVVRIKKVSDDVTEKMTRFMAEKKRIDTMDSDFQKVISLSQSMELRLEQVTQAHDTLQDIQYKIKKLEEAENDVTARFDRLEKRKEILDSTTEGVDKNYALLDKMEKTVKSLIADVHSLPTEVEDLKRRLKILAQGREDADIALGKVEKLGSLLADIEERTQKLEQAREWLARTETRLEEAGKEAQEQVRLLGTLVKGSSPSAQKGRNAPTSEIRQSVVKLSHQGWSKEEISRATKLSLGEVELILELGPRS